MTVETHTLTNGLRVIHRSFPSEISYCGVAINTGSRDEYPDEHGMAHFVEHMLFKGTKKRKAHHIANRMESVGGEINAYTTKEETFIYTTFLKEYFPRAVELLSDVIRQSEFAPRQIEREREVILDEILSYRDFPSEQIYDDFENLVYEGHDMGHYILGDPQSLQQFTSESLNRFVHREYQPSNMIFFSFGKTPFSKVVKQLEKHFDFPSHTHISVKERTKPLLGAPRKQEVKKAIVQTHMILGWEAFHMHHPDKYALYLLNNILGGGSLNSRFNSTLREKNGLVYHVESSTSLYSDTGMFTVYFASDPKNKKRCVRLINKEIEKITNKKLTPLQLSAAQRQWKGQLGIIAENNENNALSMAKNFLHRDRFVPLNEVFEHIDAVTIDTLHHVANQIFNTPPFEFSYTP